MKKIRYLAGVSTLELDAGKCTGCGMCTVVCPHGVLQMNDRKAAIADPDGCMECGACANNCPVAAVRVTPGVGCAYYIINSWIKGRRAASFGDTGCC